jgi:hypothetical protein
MFKNDLFETCKNNKNLTVYHFKSQDYYFDKRIFRVVIFLLVAIFVYVLYNNNFSLGHNLQISCDDVLGCENQFYNTSYVYANFGGGLYKERVEIPEFVKNSKMLPGGFHYGKQPIFLEKHFGEITAFFVLLSFLMNHLIHNKKFVFKKFFDELQDDDGVDDLGR